MSREQSENDNRKEEIRGIFIFGLLAVLASIRVQYASTNSQMEIHFRYGTLDFLPILDNIILLWSLYAFFMVLGLSGDIIGKTAANSFRGLATIFLKVNFAVLGVLSIPIAFLMYGERTFYILLLVVLTIIVGVLGILYKKRLQFRNRFKPLFTRRNMPLILILIFIFSAYVIFNYPEEWFAPVQVTFIAFVVSAIAVTIILFLEARKAEEDTYTSDDDYYC